MLRECHRLLQPGGRIGGYVIHTADGLTRSELERAAQLGPPQVRADAPPPEMCRIAGLRVTREIDVTTEFEVTCRALLEAREQYREELRLEEGEEAFEYELSRKAQMLQGIQDGLLRRSLVVAEKSGLTGN